MKTFYYCLLPHAVLACGPYYTVEEALSRMGTRPYDPQPKGVQEGCIATPAGLIVPVEVPEGGDVTAAAAKALPYKKLVGRW